MSDVQLITSVTLQALTELLQEAGYRVNQTEQN
ncbi:MAG: YbjN domain-containing protein, partial [Pseudomonas sp.]